MSQTKKDKKKQRVLHTRVSEELDEELREKAAGLGVSVSNLVRNILLNTVEMVEDLVADSSSIARAAGGESKKAEAPARAESAPAESELLGWQTIILHRNALCDACNAILAKGTPGMVPVYANATSTTPTFRCEACALAPSSDEATSS